MLKRSVLFFVQVYMTGVATSHLKVSIKIEQNVPTVFEAFVVLKNELRHLKFNFCSINTLPFLPVHRPCSLWLIQPCSKIVFLEKTFCFWKRNALFIRFSSPPRSQYYGYTLNQKKRKQWKNIMFKQTIPIPCKIVHFDSKPWVIPNLHRHKTNRRFKL